MSKFNSFAVVILFAVVSGCSMESRVNFQEEAGFLVAVESYISNVEDRDICTNLDDIAVLNELATKEGKKDLLKVINVEGLFFKALAKNMDVVAAMDNIEALQKTKIGEECYKDKATGKTICKDIMEDIDSSQVVISEYLKAIFGDCMANQARFATLTDVLTGLYSKHADILRGAVENASLPQAFEKFNDYASCFQEVDQYMLVKAAPFFKNLDINMTLEAASESLQPVLDEAPECFVNLFEDDEDGKGYPIPAAAVKSTNK